jgi:DNA-directed RNA polymerase subunit K/omega
MPPRQSLATRQTTRNRGHVHSNYMVDRSQLPNAFEFVAVSAARAKQLLLGCVPKVEPSLKPARTAQREVLAGYVERIMPDAPGKNG